MDWSLVFSTAGAGLTVVFIILIFLIGLIALMGRLLSPVSKRKIQKPQVLPVKNSFKLVPPVKPVPAVVGRTPRTDVQIIAAITAAIEMHSTGKIKIVSMKKRETSIRTAWGEAGIRESMR